MGNLRAKSLIEKHGFKDSDLTTPQHDKILFWSVENINKIIDDVIVKEKIKFKIEAIEPEFAITDYNYYHTKSIIGFLDLHVRFVTEKTDKFEPQTYRVGIEIKSKILSVGETIRQLNFYKEFSNNHYWIIISPDDRFQDFFEKQNIKFYKYKEDSELF